MPHESIRMIFFAVVRVRSYVCCSNETLPPKNAIYSSIC